MCQLALRATLSSQVGVFSSPLSSIHFQKLRLGRATERTSLWQEGSRAGTSGRERDQLLPTSVHRLGSADTTESQSSVEF